jgi:predicted nuclease with TOPRIM domain
VWLLESEAFKEPLKFEFTFDLEDIARLKKLEECCRDYYDLILKKEDTFNKIVDGIVEKEKMITESYKKLEEISAKYDLLLEQIKQKENIIKEKELQENNKISKLNEQLKLLENRINLPLPTKIYIHQREEFVV